MFGGKAKWARFVRPFARQRYREKGLCRDSGISLIFRKLAFSLFFAEKALSSDGVIEFTFGLRPPCPLSKSTHALGAGAISGKSKDTEVV